MHNPNQKWRRWWGENSKHFGWVVGILLLTLGGAIRHFKNTPVEMAPELRRAEKNGFSLIDQSDSLGIHFIHQLPQFNDPTTNDWFRAIYPSPGVAIADVNGDGWMDIFLNSSNAGQRNHLYLNQGGKFFTDEAERWGVANLYLDGKTSGVFFDYDNDGRPDLYVAGLGCTKLLHNNGKKFEDVTEKSGVKDCDNSISALPFDFDHDGLTDLFVIRYWAKTDYYHLQEDTEVFVNSPYDADNGGVSSVFFNNGDGTFTRSTSLLGITESRWSLDGAVADFNSSGIFRLYLANDFGPDNLYRPSGDQWINETDQMGSLDRRSGMSVSLGDLDGSGNPFVFVSNIFLNDVNMRGNFLLKFDEEMRRTDYSGEYKLENCMWAWGSAFADLDLDGRQDLYVANGHITGTKPAAATGDALFTLMSLESGPGSPVSLMSKLKSVKGLSIAGHEKDCLFMNRGTQFENAATWAGPNREWDGRAVGLIDHDNNGSVDLLVTAQEGPAHFLKNTVIPGTRWIGFKLEGVTSNRDGIGAKIQVNQGDWRGYRWATGGKTGFSTTSDPRIHFGLPDEGNVSVKVIWPRGQVQEFKNISPGKYYQVKENGKDLVPFGSAQAS